MIPYNLYLVSKFFLNHWGEKDFNDFKIAIENFSKCWPARNNDRKLELWRLLAFSQEGSLTEGQISELLDLTTKAGIVKNESYSFCVEIDWILSRLKPNEPAPDGLLNYFCNGIENAKLWFVNVNELFCPSMYKWRKEKIDKIRKRHIINNYFWSSIYRLITNSGEYIKRDDNGEKAIKAFFYVIDVMPGLIFL